MKSVLIIGMTPNPGGIESFLMTYFRKLKDTFKIDFLTTFETCAYSQEILDNNSRIYTIKSSQFKQAKEFKQELSTEGKCNQNNERNNCRYFFQHHHYDIIWFNACDLGNFGLLKYAQLCSPEKVIVHAHNNDFMMKGKKALFYKFMHYKNKKKVKQYATDYWACSELAGEFFFEDDVRQSSRYHVINNAIDTDRFKYDREVRAAYRKDLHAEDKIVVMNTARFTYQKNQLFLIDIFEELKNRNDRFELVLVGDGELRGELEQKISELNLTDSVQLLGLRSDIPELLSAADIFLFPSRFEGFGISLLEAQASGLLSFTSKTVVPKSVGITDLLTYISLDESPVEWADMIYSQFTSRDIDRNKYTDIIKEKGFDIDTEARRLKSYLDD